ncbi:MAG: complex I NDUFA9 subunit family protein [Chthonomonadales bacterium]
MRVLITGGTGFIGKVIAEDLKRNGLTVRILARSQTALERLQSKGFEVARGDVTDPGSLGPALQGVDVVVHCVGIILEPKGITFESVVQRGTENLVAACKNSGVRQILYISALGVRANAMSRYHKTKWAAEESIRNSRLTYTIFRPSTVYGAGDQFLNFFMKLPAIPLPGGGKVRFQPTFVEDLAEMVRLSLDNPEALNQTFDAGGPTTLSYKEMMQTALGVAGKKKLMAPVPMPMMKLIAAFHDPFQRIYLPLALFTKDQYLMLQEDSVGDTGPLLKALPELKMHGFEDGLRTYLPKK